ncbi:hypothetical protein NLI96_g10157 [Meripilus lineatus]|uniref:DUF4050 domain-containing protein n=1 Tax=Meripilus lineatus TaxID=2056292 RepID=A0AAD5UUA4_9APHY|nr:hypothetical protein NLI96_g10157 [Physisporinus lineatus]
MNSPPPAKNAVDPSSPTSITVTVPSSPETSVRLSPTQDAHRDSVSRFSSTGPYDFATFQMSDSLIPPSSHPSSRDPTTQDTSTPTSVSFFDQLMHQADLPEPGPAYFHARRARWCTPSPSYNPTLPQETPLSRQRLEALLNHQKPPESDEVWNAGVGKVWRGIIGGARLKRRLPLGSLVCDSLNRSELSSSSSHGLSRQIKLLMAGWIRDGTWPKGGIAPDPDDAMVMDEDGQVTTEVATPMSPDGLSRVTTPVISGQDVAGPSHSQVFWGSGIPTNT